MKTWAERENRLISAVVAVQVENSGTNNVINNDDNEYSKCLIFE